MPRAASSKKLSPKQRDELLAVLNARFEQNMPRHRGIEWAQVEERLNDQPAKLWSLQIMEETGGEPDVVGLDKKNGGGALL